jgi:hypothetical protein
MDQHLDEFLVVDPLALGHKTVAQIGNNTPDEAGGSDEKELVEDAGDGNVLHHYAGGRGMKGRFRGPVIRGFEVRCR